MKKEIVSGLALVTLSTLPSQALSFGIGNAYDSYIACHRKNGEKVSVQEAQQELKDTKLLPDKPVLQPIQVPENQIQPVPVKVPDNRMMLRYGIPYPVKIKPVPARPIYETKYGIPFPKENIVKPDKFNAPATKYGINLPVK